MTDRREVVPGATGHVVPGRLGVGRGTKGRLVAVPARTGLGTMGRGTRARVRAPAPADRGSTARGRSGVVPPARVDPRTGGGRRVPVRTEVARADHRMRGAPPARAPPARARNVVVRGPVRATGSDRVLGHGHGRTSDPTTAATRRATKPGSRTSGRRVRAGTTAIDGLRAPGRAIARVTGRAPADRPPDGLSPDRPAVARTSTGHTACGPARIGHLVAQPATRAAAVRHVARRCHHRRRSGPMRRSLPAAGRSRRPSSRGVPRFDSWSSPNVVPPSRRSCSMPRTCGSRSSRWRAVR